MPPGMATRRLGAVVVGPVTRASRRGPQPPRLAEFSGGMVLESGLQNRGIRSVLAKCAPGWPKLGCPIVVQVAERDPEDLRYVVSKLEQVRSVSGIEVLIHEDANGRETGEAVAQAATQSELPVWVKLPLARAHDLAGQATAAGAHALVIGRPVRGALMRPYATADGLERTVMVRGELYGPASFAIALESLAAVSALDLGVPLIACGGVHCWDHVQQALACGASAVQIDSVAWIEPGLPESLLALWEAESGKHGSGKER